MTSDFTTHREIDLRFEGHERYHDVEREHRQRALELAAEALRVKLLEENRVREQILEERVLMANKAAVAADMARVETMLREEFSKELNIVKNDNVREFGVLNNKLSAVGSTVSATSGDLTKLQHSEATRSGRELGKWGVVATAAIAGVTLLVNIAWKLLTG